jgi:hypothetical protein
MIDPKDDPTSIGSILVSMGVISIGQLNRAMEEQRTASRDVLIGKLLVAAGFISNEQLEVALNAQTGLRSKKPVVRANAQAEIAEQSSAAVVRIAGHLRKQSADTRRSRTGEGHEAVTDEMLCKRKS